MVLLGHWLDRFLSLGLILVIGTGLTMAKVAMMVTDLGEGVPTAWLTLKKTADLVSPSSPEIAILDEENFVPWPSILPEPAAGPEEAIGSASSDETPFFDPSTLTQGESLALQQLVTRRQALDEREEMLDMRAELNGRIEARLDQQIEKLTGLKAELESLMKGLDESEELKLARLVKIYETMKPKAAAEIFNRLEIAVLLHVFERMKESKSAAVLGKMDPAIAKLVTTELARKKERPKLAGSAVGDEA